jgi:hypothetical protein
MNESPEGTHTGAVTVSQDAGRIRTRARPIRGDVFYQ